MVTYQLKASWDAKQYLEIIKTEKSENIFRNSILLENVTHWSY